MTADEIRDEFQSLFFGTERPSSDIVLRVAQDLYTTLKQIEFVVSRSHTSEMVKIVEIKSLIERIARPAQNQAE